jgi:hypothetical protein
MSNYLIHVESEEVFYDRLVPSTTEIDELVKDAHGHWSSLYSIEDLANPDEGLDKHEIAINRLYRIISAERPSLEEDADFNEFVYPDLAGEGLPPQPIPPDTIFTWFGLE